MQRILYSAGLGAALLASCTSSPVGNGDGPREERIYFLRSESTSGDRRVWWIDPNAPSPAPILAPFEGVALEAPYVHPTDSLIVYLAPGNVVVLAHLDGRLLRIVNNDQDRWRARISPDGNLVATIRRESATVHSLYVTAWRTLVDRRVSQLRSSGATEIEGWFPGGDSLLVSGSIDGGVLREYEVIHLADGRRVSFELDFARGANTVAISPSGRFIAVGGDTGSATGGRISVFRVADWSLVREFDRPHEVGKLAFSPDDTRLVHQPAQVVGQLWDLELLDVLTGTVRVLYDDTQGTIRTPSWTRLWP